MTYHMYEVWTRVFGVLEAVLADVQSVQPFANELIWIE